MSAAWWWNVHHIPPLSFASSAPRLRRKHIVIGSSGWLAESSPRNTSRSGGIALWSSLCSWLFFLISSYLKIVILLSKIQSSYANMCHRLLLDWGIIRHNAMSRRSTCHVIKGGFILSLIIYITVNPFFCTVCIQIFKMCTVFTVRYVCKKI